MVRDRTILIFVVYCLWSIVQGPDIIAAGASDYLILQSIGEYHNSGKGKCGEGSGIIAATGHYGEDHSDLTCRTGYYNKGQDLAISIVVTQHAGSESDRWLLHEVEDGIRDSENLEEKIHDGGGIREIDGNKIFYYSHPTWGGGYYRWISNTKKVVYINYSGNKGKPEPLEVVRAYLQRFPSSITYTDAYIKSRAHNEEWLRDEMERRIWLSEKWMGLIKAQSKPEELDRVRKHLEVFLKYREKYLGVKVTQKEVEGLERVEESGDVVGMEGKVKGYREWWESNRSKPLQNVPGN